MSMKAAGAPRLQGRGATAPHSVLALALSGQVAIDACRRAASFFRRTAIAEACSYTARSIAKRGAKSGSSSNVARIIRKAARSLCGVRLFRKWRSFGTDCQPIACARACMKSSTLSTVPTINISSRKAHISGKHSANSAAPCGSSVRSQTAREPAWKAA